MILKFENISKFGKNQKFEKNWKNGINLTIRKEIGNSGKIWKFGKNLEIWKKFGNLEKKNWKSRKIIES